MKVYLVEEWDYEGGYALKAFACKEKAEKFARQSKKDRTKTFKQLNKCTWAAAKSESNDFYIRELELDAVGQSEQSAVDCIYEKYKAEEGLSAYYKAKLDDANELLNQRYIDEKGTVWTIPTPEAYAIVCKKMHGLKTSNELLRIRLRDYKAWIQKHRTDRKLKWIDVNDAMPKDDELIVLLIDNGKIDIGKGYWVAHGFMVAARVTHWMPLPEMPQIDGGKNNESK